LIGSTAATVVLAWSPSARAFFGHPGHAADAVSVPNFDGQLLVAPAQLAAAADDFGHAVHKSPFAVLLPGSKHDIVKLVAFARAHRIHVGGMSMIGNTHSVYGQSQVEGGVVIDMSGLSTIHSIDAQSAVVDAGVRWIDLLEATTPLGLSPPVLTDHIDLSVGGTLSVGGVSGQTYEHGMLVDNVLAFEVVTGKGELVSCSPSHNPELFHAVRGGIGQFGIIVRARVRLVAVPGMVRRYNALYGSLTDMMADQEMVLAESRFEYIEGFAVPAPDGGWMYQIELVKYYAPGAPPDDATLLGDLAYDAGTLTVEDVTHFDFLNRLAPTVEFLKQVGAWELPHPWIDMFVPGSQAATFIASVLATTTQEDMGGGPILIYPFARAKVTAPFVALPDEPICYLFSLLRTALPETVGALLSQNRGVYEALRDMGGKRYAATAVPFSPADWRDHFGATWPLFAWAKKRFDPKGILTPGPRIF